MDQVTSTTDTQAVMDVLQRVYGDATQTVLDHQAASEVIAELRRRGWASLDDVARIIVAAGGEVTIPDRLMLSGEEYEEAVTIAREAGLRRLDERRPRFRPLWG